MSLPPDETAPSRRAGRAYAHEGLTTPAHGHATSERNDMGAAIGMSDTLPASAREIAAKAWDEGRESFALDLLKPTNEIGIRESTRNPYRQPSEALGGKA